MSKTFEENPRIISTTKDSFMEAFFMAKADKCNILKGFSFFIGSATRFDKANSNIVKNNTKTMVFMNESIVISQPKNMGVIILTAPARPDL